MRHLLRRLRARHAVRRPGVAATAAGPHRDQGSSVMLVLATLTTLAVVGSVGLTAAVRTLQTTDRSEDWQAALAAAEAGVADYLARLHKNDNYWNTKAWGSGNTRDCSNKAFQGPPSKIGTTTCGWTASTPIGWAKVPGSDRAYFHYDVDVQTTTTDGVILLTSTGKVGDATRTVQTRLRRDGFGEFLYYTKYESGDTQGLTAAQAAACERYDWPSLGNERRSKKCNVSGYSRDIYFVSGDVINGPMHSNDAILARDNPRFRGTTTTSNPSCRAEEGYTPTERDCYRTLSYSANPIFDRGIAWRGELEPPASIGDLRQYVTKGNANFSGGCLYTGPTRIKFLPTSGTATPKMRVWSRYTQSSELNSPTCGNAGTGTNQLGHSGGQEVPVPQNNLILVQDVPSTPASRASSPTSGDCKVTGRIGDGLPLADPETSSNPYPNYDINLDLAESNCRYGTVYVQGTLKGRVTLAADNNVIVTDDLKYHGGQTGTDALGLIASNSVKIYHPVRVSGRSWFGTSYANLSGTRDDITVQAAILSLQHSFTVQQYDRGAKLDKLTVFGTIAQKFRGPVGTGNGSSGTGYIKDYNYDTRLRFSPPPYFLDPVGSGWGQKTFGEIPPKY